ncbi:MAG: sugar ABC transporter ATP-binding protein [Synergistaceae bacterium]|jgi:ribose transport system ATP-binding protein|nr:sugar ABC transporter ATP-binding protein [Synergistaceae bacterium]
MSGDGEFILEAKNICKSYPGVQALDNVSLCVRKGETHALVGENGAGKSTLIKILSGSLQRDAGEIRFEGAPPVGAYSPQKALDMGISVIYQEFNLLPQMTVEENLHLGREFKKSIFLDKKAMLEHAGHVIGEFNLDIDPSARVSELSAALRQMVEIVKAVLNDSKLLIMDEPSASLSNREMETLFRLIRELRKKGRSVIYISHRLEEIYEIADRVTILRDGKYITTREVASLSRNELIKNMVGYDIPDTYPLPAKEKGDVVISVSNLCNEKLKEISFDVRSGEIFGIGGLVGSGRTEIARALFGADKCEGRVEIKGRPVDIRHPRDAIRMGVGLVPEERKTQGLLLNMSVAVNLSLACLGKLSRFMFVDKRKEKKLVDSYVSKVNIKTPSVYQLTGNLSGGNQQKLVVTKWLATDCDIMIFDEPTRGIDIGAKQEIYRLMSDLTKTGRSIIVISSELPELIGMSDRILIMYEGCQMKILDKKNGDISQEYIMALASGERV